MTARSRSIIHLMKNKHTYGQIEQLYWQKYNPDRFRLLRVEPSKTLNTCFDFLIVNDLKIRWKTLSPVAHNRRKGQNP